MGLYPRCVEFNMKTLSLLCCLLVGLSACSQIPKRDINADYKAAEMNPKDLVARFESQGREVFDRRKGIVKALKLKKGAAVADLGAGTGLFVSLLAESVGTKGKVYAIDIIPKFITFINERVKAEGLTQVSTVLSTERTIELADASVDMIFTSDTYHHFYYYQDMLSSIYKALKKNGEFIVVEYDISKEGIPDFMIGHVGNTPEQITQQILDNNFELVEDFTLPGMTETFMRRFRKNNATK